MLMEISPPPESVWKKISGLLGARDGFIVHRHDNVLAAQPHFPENALRGNPADLKIRRADR